MIVQIRKGADQYIQVGLNETNQQSLFTQPIEGLFDSCTIDCEIENLSSRITMPYNPEILDLENYALLFSARSYGSLNGGIVNATYSIAGNTLTILLAKNDPF